MCRGRRQRKFFSQRLGQLRLADLDALARLDLGHEARDRPVGPVGDGSFEQRRDDTQRGFGLYRWRAGRHGRLQRLDTAARELAAPKTHRVFAHAEGFRNARAGPSRQRQQYRPRPISLAPVA